VIALARAHSKPIAVVCGDATNEARAHAERLGVGVVTLRDEFGDAAMTSPKQCVRDAALISLRRWSS